MRKLGMSYSQIKSELNLSKNTLSRWLQNRPLSKERIIELRDKNERRVERCRETKAHTRAVRLEETFRKVSEQIGLLSEREFFLAGLLLYWAEGTKAERGLVQLTNTDPSMLNFFIHWLESEGIPRCKIRVKLHLYADMDISQKTEYWRNILGVNEGQFVKPYIKTTVTNKRINYKGRFGMGTCSLTVNNIGLYEKIITGIEHIRNAQSGIPGFSKV